MPKGTRKRNSNGSMSLSSFQKKGGCDQIPHNNSVGHDVRLLMMKAVAEGDTKALLGLLEQERTTTGDNLMVNTTKSNGHTLLMTAARRNDVGIVEVLLQHGADVNVAARSGGETALLLAAEEGHLDVLRLLLAVDSLDIDAVCGVNKITPLMKAAHNGHTAVVKCLVLHGASINAAANHGTPLMKAAVRGHVGIAEFLIQHGADIDGTDGSGNTALIQAAHMGRLAMVKLLLAHGACVKMADDGDVALLCAVSRSAASLQVTEALLACGADPNDALDANGRTVLTSACLIGNTPHVALLLSHGASTNTVCAFDDTPFTASRKVEITQLLLEQNVSGCAFHL